MPVKHETISAIATPAGRGGIAIVRISGPDSVAIARQITGIEPVPRQVSYCVFYAEGAEVIDQGILLYFKGPGSYTGEDVIELHGHGGPVVVNVLLNRIVSLGARLARPGEFTERAFLNGKLDLAQAEAVADLIESKSEQAARCAIRSLQGEFSGEVAAVSRQLMDIRVYVEGSLDFPEEEIDLPAESEVAEKLDTCLHALQQLLRRSRKGQVLRDGVRMVIIGRPNVGKSSLLNSLTRTDRAIVTEVPGTTRDVIEEAILIDGIYFNIADTAGIHDTVDRIEQEGIRRSLLEIDKADVILLVTDAVSGSAHDMAYFKPWLPADRHVIQVVNKIDLTDCKPGKHEAPAGNVLISLSAKTGDGVALLLDELKNLTGLAELDEDIVLARARHMEALEKTTRHLQAGRVLQEQRGAPEILAEELQLAQQTLGLITGEVHADDVLGEIFSRFCIGK
jgi:tRNA modification GTPase